MLALLIAEELAHKHKLFHGLTGTNQGIHQHQLGTVLSTGFSRQSGNVLGFSDRAKITRMPRVVNVSRLALDARAHERFHDHG